VINPDKYNRSVSMLCPTCGESQFEYDAENLNDSSLVKCTHCQMTMTKAHLVETNSETIAVQAEEMGKEIVEDFKKDLRNALGGSKFIKII